LPLRRRRRVTAALLAALVVDAGASLLFMPAAGASSLAGNNAGEESGEEAQRSGFATLEIIEPGVSVKKKGKDEFTPGEDGQTLRVGDTVKTDETGFAAINYTREEDTFTRLDVNTEFTIVRITDEEGDRQVNGSVDSGRVWNRTTALTESETFSTEGAGATAVVEGSAYLVSCLAPGNCIFISVVDGLKVTTVDGEVQLLDPLEQCGSTEVTEEDANLCAVPEQVALEVLLADGWIAENIFLDALGGFPVPTVGVITVENGQVTSFTPVPPPPPPPPPASTPITYNGSPGTGAPPSTLGPYAMTPFGDDARAEFTPVEFVPAPGGGNITFSSPLELREVPSSWSTWSNGYTGDVYFHQSADPLTINLPDGTYAFYFYAESNAFEELEFVATANDGTSSGPVLINGNGGAKYFGFYSTSPSNPLTSITISCEACGTGGFAIGEFGINQDGSTTSAASTSADEVPTESAVAEEPAPEPGDTENAEELPAPEPTSTEAPAE
jgi:hypothetical protein